MKKSMIVLLILCVLGAFFAVSFAQASAAGDIILLTVYRQEGNASRFALGALDSNGALWSYTATDCDDIPYVPAELIEWIENAGLESAGALSDKEFNDIRSMVISVPDMEVNAVSAADDAGAQTSYAIRRDGEERSIVVLGKSGDSVYENTDPSAQALYAFLRRYFPDVPDFREDANMHPAGFRPAGILEYCGYNDIDPAAVTLTAYANDCETGSTQIEPDRTVEEILSMKVTGKKNSMFTTGNTKTYCFTDADGKTLAAFEFYGDLLVCGDGMYSVAY